MPTYEYRCPACTHRFETRQGFDDPPAAHCPKCQALSYRVFSPATVVFKGSGWYSTDHRSSSAGHSSNGSKASETSESDSGSKTPESASTSTPDP